MKGTFAAAAVAALTGAASASHAHRHAHELFAAKRFQTGEVCVPGCTTIWSTITGEPTRMFDHPPRSLLRGRRSETPAPKHPV